ncbi:sodium-coupled monocarboxylate transporter 1 [Gadus morhua]|uniref:sodium-coupled monocarboxylate transporter 1 n=1 Tax=Gadus morhua TaxID=8049 RepID=UPI0011B48A9A|nr:sodium-coupled monocarboxylate transporter 1 [Gadus morhua]
MPGDLPAVGSFVAADYVVFALMLLVSAAVGVYYAWVDRSQGSTGDFLMGGRSLTAVPVSLSLTAGFMSAITVLASPAEVYRYGAVFGLVGLSYIFTVVVTSEIFLPVFYRLAITSTYEYLELRFNRATRLMGTVLFIVQTVLYTGIVIYAPALALNQVTGMDLWGAVVSTGIVCTFYCTLGGLKAVVWTDVFQVGVMLAGFMAVIIRSVLLQGGIGPIIQHSQQGGRLNLWDFDMNPLRRHTFWTLTVGGTFVWVSVYGINQAQVQRYLSCKTITHARMALYLNLIGLWVVLVCSVISGLCLYSVYKSCDPWTTGQVTALDQLMPYLVMDILRSYPGVPGLFVAAAYSGSLSTVSSSINALTAVTVEDLIRPHIDLSEKHLSWASKGLSLLYGALCIAMAAIASLMGGVLQAAITIFGIIGGPLLGLFTLGILFPFANSKGAVLGLLSGLVVALWVGIGAQIYPPPAAMSRPLDLSTAGCNFSTGFSNWSSTALPPPHSPFTRESTFSPESTTLLPPHGTVTPGSPESSVFRPVLADSWYSVSYMYFSPIGTLTALTVGVVVSLLSGGWKVNVDSRLTLMKEDTTCYHIFRFFKEKVAGRTRNFDLTKNEARKMGNTNLAFSDVELDLTKGHVTT